MLKRRCMTLVVSIFLFMPAMIQAEDNVPRVTVEALKARIDKGGSTVILDVRTTGSWMASNDKIKGALRIPIGALESRWGELSKESEIVAYCT
ncbi:MAG: rhodanese-like domain-containing protein [Deltaproteobacteria bacterium]|nr:rhodanese-like domain-containing protein [Deltaproteobacteria bacterium]